MLKFQNDQAASLRRIMARPEPRVVSVISASLEANQPLILTNLAATISASRNNVLIVHAGQESIDASRSYGTNALPSLRDVAQGKSSLTQSIKHANLGFSTTKLQPKNQNLAPLDSVTNAQISEVFNGLASRYDFILVDAALNKNYELPISALNESKILIQLTREPESTKQAYILIKQIYQQRGRVNIGIIVTGASDAHAAVVFRNIAQVARRFLLIDLEFFGAIPADVHIHRAAKLGRSVIDAFPRVAASIAFKSLAQRLNYQQNRSTKLEHASLA